MFGRFMTPTPKPAAASRTATPHISSASKRRLSKGPKIDTRGLASNPAAGQAQAAAMTGSGCRSTIRG